MTFTRMLAAAWQKNDSLLCVGLDPDREGRFTHREEAGHLRHIVRFAQSSNSGDRGELADVPENSGSWLQATSTRDNCLGQDCPYLDRCFVMRARRQALAADVVVVNHHLFFADVMLRDEGLGELLPACNAVIFDTRGAARS